VRIEPGTFRTIGQNLTPVLQGCDVLNRISTLIFSCMVTYGCQSNLYLRSALCLRQFLIGKELVDDILNLLYWLKLYNRQHIYIKKCKLLRLKKIFAEVGIELRPFRTESENVTTRPLGQMLFGICILRYISVFYLWFYSIYSYWIVEKFHMLIFYNDWVFWSICIMIQYHSASQHIYNYKV